MDLLASYRKVPLLTKLLVAMVIGAALGAIFGTKVTVIKPLGTIFLNLLKMVTIPLVVVNLISGISALDDPNVFGRVGIKIMLYYTLTTVGAIILGILVGYIFKPGAGFVLEGAYSGTIEKIPSLGDTIIGLIPANIFNALNLGRFDQIVVFSAFIGVAILFTKKEERVLLNKAFAALASMFNRAVGLVMGFAPLGIMALMANTVGKYGPMLAGFIAKYIGASYAAIVIHIFVYLLLLRIFANIGPIAFLRKASPLMVTALSTSSSLACVPVGLSCSDDLGVPRSISSFTIPLGSQVNKDGNGIMLALTFLFAAQAVNTPLSIGILLKAVLIALILTTGAGGVPGGGIVTIAIMIDAFGLPLEVVGIVSGIFALIDMGFTMMNVLGDLVGTYIVSYSEARRTAKTKSAA